MKYLSDNQLKILSAIILYVYSEAPDYEKNIDTVKEFIKALYPVEFDLEFDLMGRVIDFQKRKSAVELLFDEFENENPDHDSVKLFNESKYYKN